MAGSLSGIVTTYDTRKLKQELEEQKSVIAKLKEDLEYVWSKQIRDNSTRATAIDELHKSSFKQKGQIASLTDRVQAMELKIDEKITIVKKELLHEIYKVDEQVDEIYQKTMILWDEQSSSDEESAENPRE